MIRLYGTVHYYIRNEYVWNPWNPFLCARVISRILGAMSLQLNSEWRHNTTRRVEVWVTVVRSVSAVMCLRNNSTANQATALLNLTHSPWYTTCSRASASLRPKFEGQGFMNQNQFLPVTHLINHRPSLMGVTQSLSHLSLSCNTANVLPMTFPVEQTINVHYSMRQKAKPIH